MGEDVRRTDVNVCRSCQIEKTLDCFYNLKKNPDCKECRSKKDKEYYKGNTNKFREKSRRFRKENPEKIKGWYLKGRYNLTLEEYNNKLQEQNGACQICKRTNINLVVDHNHSTGDVRGLLCSRCNLAFGALEENLDILQSMINYKDKYQK